MAVNFLTINGWELPIHEGDFAEDTEEGGHRSRSFNGNLLANRRYVKRRFSGTTQLLTADEAKAVRGLLFGYGNTWDFERDATDYFSYKGHGPEPGGNGTNTGSVGNDFTRGLIITSGGEWQVKSVMNDIVWDGEWTVIVHADTGVGGGGGYERILLRDSDAAGEAWINGSFDAAANVDNCITFTEADGFKFLGKRRDTGADILAGYDNITILPFRVTDEMAAVFSSLTNTFSPLPHIKVRTAYQDSETSSEMLCLGDVSDVEYVQARVDKSGAVFAFDNERITFTLEEDSVEAL